MLTVTKRLASLLLCSLLCCAALANASASALISADPPEPASAMQATLYYRYLDSEFLGQETRSLQVPLNQSQEMAIVEALLDGPGPASPMLRPLFPAGTKVLSLLGEGGLLYVTFNQHLMDAYPGEDLQNQAYVSAEGRARRRLAMASLVNSLTESGQVRQVQVLVQGQEQITASLRLSSRYYLLDSDSLEDPLLRQEELIIKPGQAAHLFLKLWEQRAFPQLQRLLFIPAQDPEILRRSAALSELPTLLVFSTSAGSQDATGSRAVCLVKASILTPSGEEVHLADQPLLMIRKDGVWKAEATSLFSLVDRLLD